MNITLLNLVLALLFLTVPGYIFWLLDRPSLHRLAVVVGRSALTMAVLAVALHYVFLWNRGWLTLLWVLLSGGVGCALYCRRRWLAVPVYVSSTLSALLVGLAVLLLTTRHAVSPLSAHLFIPVVSIMQADALFVGRRSLTLYALYRREYASLCEYLLASGATPMEAQRPLVAQVLKRTFAPVMGQLLLAGAVFVPSLLVGLLLVGIEPYQAIGFMAILMLGGVCCAALSLVTTLYIYYKVKK